MQIFWIWRIQYLVQKLVEHLKVEKMHANSVSFQNILHPVFQERNLWITATYWILQWAFYYHDVGQYLFHCSAYNCIQKILGLSITVSFVWSILFCHSLLKLTWISEIITKYPVGKNVFLSHFWKLMFIGITSVIKIKMKMFCKRMACSASS